MVDIGIFTRSRSGRIYGNPRHTILELGNYPDNLKFKLPCWISVDGNRQVVVYAVDGLPDSVKMDMGFGGWKLVISSELGDYDIREIYKLAGGNDLVAIDDVHDLAAYFRNLSKEVKAVDKEGLLAALGITHVFITDVHLDPKPDRPGAYSLTLNCLSELAHGMSALDMLTRVEE